MTHEFDFTARVPRAPDPSPSMSTNPQPVTLGVLCGGRSGEHEVSLQSAVGIYGALDRSRFRPLLVAIAKDGTWRVGSAGALLLDPHDPERIRSHSVRATAPVFPCETIRTEMWNADGGLSFRSRVVERNAVALGSGWVEFND